MTPPAFSGRIQWSHGVRSHGRFRCGITFATMPVTEVIAAME
jgi:hypothetical protein